MKVITEYLQGDLLDVDEEIELRGEVMGYVRVAAGGNLVVRGKIGAALIVLPGATAHVYGVVGHHIYNAGGNVVIHGGSTVGRHLDTESGVTKVLSGATIGGKLQTEGFIHLNK